MSPERERANNATEDLSSAARSLLEACAVLGEHFTFPQLISILGAPGDHGTSRFVDLSGWAKLRTGGLIVADDPARPERFRFARTRDRERLLERLDAVERERLEARVAASTLGGVSQA